MTSTFDAEADTYEQDMLVFLKGTSRSTPVKELTLVVDEPPYPEIRIDQNPTQARWALVPLYKIAASGDLLYWQIRFNGVSHLEIHQGYSGGIQTDRISISHPEQAFREARFQYKRKFREGYQPAGDISPVSIKGMKGYPYKPTSIKSWPVYTQPKLHGIRMLSNFATPRLHLRSWLNNPFLHLTHIETELGEFFEYLPRNAILDGELYQHELRFATLTSIVKTVKEVHPDLHRIQYWIFDVDYQDPDGAPFEKRYELLVNAFRRYLQDRSPTNDPNDVGVLPTTFRIVPAQLAQNHNEVIQQHRQHVGNGFEGIMVKKISNRTAPDSKIYRESLYQPKKCNHILKYKLFQDEEVIVIDTEGMVQDKRGHRYPIRMRGNFDASMVGKEVTIRYQDTTPTGIPVDPIGIAIRNYE